MGDMFDTYNRVRAQGLSNALHRNAAESQQIIIEKNREISDLKAEVDMWKGHYLGLEAERDYLLELLDEVHGIENNPARETSSDSIRIPNGPRAGQLIQNRDRIYLARLKRFISEKASYLGSWKSLIRDNHIFD